MDDCVFCAVEKNIKGHVMQHSIMGQTFYAFTPLNPVTPGHVLVVPKVHVANASENPVIAGYGAELAALIARLHDSANIITSIGKAATQSVMHLHWHVVPRTEDDGLHLPWTGQM